MRKQPNHRCASAVITCGPELSVALRHLGRDAGHDVPMLGNLAVVDTEEIEERRWLTAEHPLRRGEHEVTFRDGLHLLVMIAALSRGFRSSWKHSPMRIADPFIMIAHIIGSLRVIDGSAHRDR